MSSKNMAHEPPPTATPHAPTEATAALIPPVAVMADGWSEWVHPVSPFRMQCCDCGLIHELEFAVVEPNGDEPHLNDGESEGGVIVFRARRWSGCTCDGVHPGSYANQELVDLPWGGKAGIDRCILPEVRRLWSLGVRTIESCCGHGIPGYIAVTPPGAEIMLVEGYARETRTAAPNVFTWPSAAGQDLDGPVGGGTRTKSTPAQPS